MEFVSNLAPAWICCPQTHSAVLHCLRGRSQQGDRNSTNKALHGDEMYKI
jgi:hypothetical protein